MTDQPSTSTAVEAPPAPHSGPRPMHVLVTVPWGQRLGGAESMLQALLERSTDGGHRVDLLFFEDGPWPQELAAAGFQVDVIATGRLRQVGALVRAVRSLVRLMRERDPDLIVNWSAKTQLYGSPAAVIARMSRRVIWWQHAIPRRTWMDSLATLLPAAAIGCCSRTAADAQARLFPARPSFVVAPGTADPRAAEAASPGPEAAPAVSSAGLVVGLVGRLEPWKGQDRLLRAIALLRERGHDVRALIVGGDAYEFSTEYARSLPGLVAELGLEEHVTLTGQVPDAGPYIEQMDVLVNASDSEPFGIVLLEGMARGVAVLAVDAGGPAEIIADGATGVLAASGEPAALAEALQRLLEDPELRASVAAGGRASFASDYTDVAMGKRFFTELRRVKLRSRVRPYAGPRRLTALESRSLRRTLRRLRARAGDPVLDWLFARRSLARASGRTHVLCVGDSHVGVLERAHVADTWFRARPLNGATATGILNLESRTGSRATFDRALERAKPWQRILLQLGEVDCGFIIWARAERHGLSVDEQLRLTLDSYATFIAEVQARGFAGLTVLSAPLPTIGDDPAVRGEIAHLRKAVNASQQQRTTLTIAFNAELARRCATLGVEFVDLTDALLDADTGLLAARYRRATHHDHHLADEPYAELIGSALSERWRPAGDRSR